MLTIRSLAFDDWLEPEPLRPAVNHLHAPPPVSTPTKPLKSRFWKSAVVVPPRSLLTGPRVIVPVARSRDADLSGLFLRVKAVPVACDCALADAPNRARAAPARISFLGTIMTLL